MPSVLSRPELVVQGDSSARSSRSGGWLDVLDAFCSRAVAPFEELADDLCDTARFLMPGHAEVGRGKPNTSLELQPYVKASGSQTGGLNDLQAALLEVLERAGAPLKELNEDSGPCGALAVLAALGPAASAAATGKVLLALCGLGLKTKALYVLSSMAMFGGAYSVWHRHPDVTDRTLQYRSAALLLISGVANVALGLGLGIPPSISAHVANPEVVAHLLPNVIVIPMLIMNLGYLSGRRADQMVPTVGFGLLSTVGLIAAAASPDGEALPLLVTGMTCLCKAAFDINRVLPVCAGSVSAVNKMRSQISADLMVFAWVGYPLLVGLGFAHGITLSSEIHAFVALDLIGKLGVSHIVLRSPEAFANAQRVLSSEPRAQ